ncbi:MAG TPA: cupin domain-containing protein [Bacteroidia bacterium]|jgi:mannose-6-phosphate isomerase-like protein (cupin superfamily)|nr:cupin domain-containing protein [Bacteroidia bacterium]HQF27912.1 cupin domain-containing protein [Bacteroidia bacterium]HQK97805.1 cupin domain-containing protein [Bacteroidia bacterium]
MKTNKEASEHYNWGNKCDAWKLLTTDQLSVIEERMPAGTEEMLHFHQKAQQFFYVLSGLATFEIEGQIIEVNKNEGIRINPGQHHKIKNLLDQDLTFIVISQPNAHGDRINISL